ncbi:hypothetical protein [Priestia megaterium]|uniref:hypothetical protein n=1 Tax=Priestia megaterium TaxID=1404 RepID=UPI0031FD1D22
MLVGEMIEQLNGNETTTTLAKKLGRSKQTVQKMIKSIGYEFSNKTKLWTFEGEGEPPLHTDVEELLGKARKPRKSSTPSTSNKSTTTTKQVEDNNTYNALTQDEISTLRAIIKQYNETATTLEVDNNLHSRIIQLEADDKPTRKTVFLNKEVASQLDDFAKRNRVNNSDIVELALLDFIAKYSK